ncbi:MAG TPA: thioredoxin domain-containing protein [Candidatus Polarisedimenticolia bacterium]|nr:thioredoxin domain-containing protein [Candidatus Polarisedimenticolia bacterium]
MARFGGIFLNIFLVIFLAVQPAASQSTGSTASKKAGATGTPAAEKGKAASAGKSGTKTAKKTTKKAAKTKPTPVAAPLTPEVTHRIITEIRSRYNVPPRVTMTVSDPKPGTTSGYDDLVVSFFGGTTNTHHDFLISTDRKMLAHLEKIDISQDLMSKIDVKGRPVKGNPNAKVTIVNFDDFQCPFCSRMHSALFDNLFKDYADKIKVIYKDYPLIEIHPWAMHAAIDGNCLGEQNGPAYWDFADYIHANQKLMAGKSKTDAFLNLDNMAKEQAQKHQLDADKLQACMQKQDETAVRASMAEGDKLGVDSTPTLFINGERFTGAVPESELRAVLNRALADNGEQAPANAKN